MSKSNQSNNSNLCSSNLGGSGFAIRPMGLIDKIRKFHRVALREFINSPTNAFVNNQVGGLSVNFVVSAFRQVNVGLFKTESGPVTKIMGVLGLFIASMAISLCIELGSAQAQTPNWVAKWDDAGDASDISIVSSGNTTLTTRTATIETNIQEPRHNNTSAFDIGGVLSVSDGTFKNRLAKKHGTRLDLGEWFVTNTAVATECGGMFCYHVQFVPSSSVINSKPFGYVGTSTLNLVYKQGNQVESSVSLHVRIYKIDLDVPWDSSVALNSKGNPEYLAISGATTYGDPLGATVTGTPADDTTNPIESVSYSFEASSYEFLNGDRKNADVLSNETIGETEYRSFGNDDDDTDNDGLVSGKWLFSTDNTTVQFEPNIQGLNNLSVSDMLNSFLDVKLVATLNGQSTTLLTTSLTVNIIRTDGTLQVYMSADSLTVTEGQEFTLNLTADPAPSSPITLDGLSISGFDGEIKDGSGTADSPVTISSDMAVPITLQTVDDGVYTEGGTLRVSLADDTGYVSSFPKFIDFTITDSLPVPTIELTTSVTQVNEGETFEITLASDQPLGEGFSLEIDSLFVDSNGFSGTLSAGESGNPVTIDSTGPTTVTVTATEDLVYSNGGTMTVSLNDGDGYKVDQSGELSTVSISVIENEPVPVVSLSSLVNPVDEGGLFSITVLTEPELGGNHTLSITSLTIEDTGFAGSLSAGTADVPLVISRGLSLSVTVIASDDDVYSHGGVLTVRLEDGPGFTVNEAKREVSTTVTENEAIPAVSLSTIVDPLNVTEGETFLIELNASPKPGGDYYFEVDTLVVDEGGFAGELAAGTVQNKQVIGASGMARIPVTAIDDSVYSNGGTMSISLMNGKGYTDVDGFNSIDINVIENDDQPVVFLSTSVTNVDEGVPFDITLSTTTRLGHNVPLAVNSLTVAEGFSASLSAGTTTVPARIDSSGNTVVSVTPTDDSEETNGGTLIIRLGDGTNYTAAPNNKEVTVTVLENDGVSIISVATEATSVSEGGNFNVTLRADQAPTVGNEIVISTLSIDSAGVIGNLSGGNSSTSPLTIGTEGEVTVIVTVVADRVFTNGGKLRIHLSGGSGYAPDSSAYSVTVPVVDNESIPVVSLTAMEDEITLDEGESFAVTLSTDSVLGDDYILSVTTLSITGFAGELSAGSAANPLNIDSSGSALVIVTATDDNKFAVDGGQQLTVSLSDDQPEDGAAARYTAHSTDKSVEATVNDNEPIPVISIANAPTVNEGEGAAVFPISLTVPPASDELVITYTAVVGEARYLDTDAASYGVPKSRTIGPFTQFSASEPYTANLAVAIHNDTFPEVDGTVIVTILSQDGVYELSETAYKAIVNVTDNDSDVTAARITNQPAIYQTGNFITLNINFSGQGAANNNFIMGYRNEDGREYDPNQKHTSNVALGTRNLSIDYLKPTNHFVNGPLFTTGFVRHAIVWSANRYAFGHPDSVDVWYVDADTPGISLSITEDEIAESGTFTVVATATPAPNSIVDVPITFTDPSRWLADSVPTNKDSLRILPGATMSRPLSVTTRAMEGLQRNYEIVVTVDPDENDDYHVDASVGSDTVRINESQFQLALGHGRLVEGAADAANNMMEFRMNVTPAPGPGDSVTVEWAASVDLSNNDSATGGMDFTASSANILTVPTDGTPAVILVPIIGDNVPENNETFTVTLSNPSVNASIVNGTATGTIVNDDGFGLSVADGRVIELDDGLDSEMTFMVSLFPPPQPDVTVSVEWSTIGDVSTGAAELGDGVSKKGDYIKVEDEILTFEAGESTKYVYVTVFGDDEREVHETFSVVLSEASTTEGEIEIVRARARGTILNDDGSYLSIGSDLMLNEGHRGETEFEFTVTLEPTATRDVFVDWSTVDGTANAGMDFVGVASKAAGGIGELEFLVDRATGETPATATITISVAGDKNQEDNETFSVMLNQIRGAELKPNTSSSVQGTILNDDQGADPCVLSECVYMEVESGNREVMEGAPAIFTIRSEEANSDRMIEIRVSQIGDNIFLPVPENVRLANSIHRVEIPTFDNNVVDEMERSITVEIVVGSGGYLVYDPNTDASKTIMIRDNDTPANANGMRPTVAAMVLDAILSASVPNSAPQQSPSPAMLPNVSIAAVTGSIEEGSAADFNLRFSNSVELGVTVNVSLTESGGLIGRSQATTVYVAPESSSTLLSVATIDDEIADGNGWISVVIEEGEGYEIGEQDRARVEVTDLVDLAVRRGQLTAANDVILPHLVGSIGARSLGAASQRVTNAFVPVGSSHLMLGGQSKVTDLLRSGGESINDGRFSWEQFLGDSSFEFGLFPEEGLANPATVWGLGDFRQLPIEYSTTSSGEVFSGYVGVDVPIDSGLVAGLTTSIINGEFDHGVDGEAIKFQSRSTGLHPYFGYQSRDGRAQMQMIAGFGQGDIELDQEQYDIENWGSDFVNLGLGGTQILYSGKSNIIGGNIEWLVSGESWIANQTVHTGDSLLGEIHTTARHVRVNTEGSFRQNLDNGSTASQSIIIGLREDGKDRQTFHGMEIGGSLGLMGFHGFDVSSSSQMILFETNQIRELGVSGLLRYDLGNDQLGMLVNVVPEWSRSEIGTDDVFWGTSILDHSYESDLHLDGTRMRVEVGYGMEMWDENGRLKPFGEVVLTDSEDWSYTIGSDVNLNPETTIEIEGSSGHRNNRHFANEISVSGKFRW